MPHQPTASDLLSQLEMMKAALALQGGLGLPGGNLLRLGGEVRALQDIPITAGRGVGGGELGFAPQGTIFTGGSPHELDFTGRRVQNAIFLLDQLARSEVVKNLFKKKARPTAQNSVTADQEGFQPIIDLLRVLR